MSPPSLLSEPPRAPAALKGVLPALSDPRHGRAPTARLGSCGPCTPSGVLREFTGMSALCPRAIRLEGQGVCPPRSCPMCEPLCAELGCALMPPAGTGEGRVPRSEDRAGACGSPEDWTHMGPCPHLISGQASPLPHSLGARTPVSRPCRAQALLQQRPWPRKSIPFLILISFKGSGLEKSDSGVLT